MLNQTSISAVDNHRFDGNFVRPMYGQYCFSGIPGTVERLLTGSSAFDALPDDVVGGAYQQFDQVILLFIDAFGWRFLTEYLGEFDALKNLEQSSIVSKLTSQFPSTTANHVSLIHSAQQPGATGIFEYTQYDTLLDSIVAPLVFRKVRGGPGENLIGVVEPEDFSPLPLIHQSLAAKGVDSVSLIPDRIAGTAITKLLSRVGKTIPYARPDHCFDELATLASQAQSPAYYYMYYPDFDSLLHQHGTSAKQPKDLARNLFNLIQDNLIKPIRASGKKVALLLCADHGMTEVSPRNTYYLNQQLPELSQHILRCASGELRTPSGSCRDFFLHLASEQVQSAKALLVEKLAGRARVFETAELMSQGFFGNQGLCQRFKDNIGQLVILPEKGEAVWWYEKGVFEQYFFGMHGGLTPDEMEIPFFYHEIK